MRIIPIALLSVSSGKGPFNPTIKSMISGWEWKWDISFPTEEEAQKYALSKVQEAEDAAEKVAQTWGLEEV